MAQSRLTELIILADRGIRAVPAITSLIYCDPWEHLPPQPV